MRFVQSDAKQTPLASGNESKQPSPTSSPTLPRFVSPEGAARVIPASEHSLPLLGEVKPLQGIEVV
jgi:hypothetical protein